MRHPHHRRHFYGTATIGAKGQVVIPAEARTSMKLKKGDKLMVFGMGQSMVAFAKFEQLEQFADRLSAKLESIRQIMKEAK